MFSNPQVFVDLKKVNSFSSFPDFWSELETDYVTNQTIVVFRARHKIIWPYVSSYLTQENNVTSPVLTFSQRLMSQALQNRHIKYNFVASRWPPVASIC